MTDKGKQQVKHWDRKIAAALKLFPSQASADEVIGALPEKQARQYNTLIQAGEALSQMLWAMAQANGARKTKATLKMVAQGQLILLNLIHFAFALGVQWGRADGRANGS